MFTKSSLHCKDCGEMGKQVLPCDWCEEGVCPTHAHHVTVLERGVRGTWTESKRLCSNCKPNE